LHLLLGSTVAPSARAARRGEPEEGPAALGDVACVQRRGSRVAKRSSIATDAFVF
jgi:hypothetical protein